MGCVADGCQPNGQKQQPDQLYLRRAQRVDQTTYPNSTETLYIPDAQREPFARPTTPGLPPTVRCVGAGPPGREQRNVPKLRRQKHNYKLMQTATDHLPVRRKRYRTTAETDALGHVTILTMNGNRTSATDARRPHHTYTCDCVERERQNYLQDGTFTTNAYDSIGHEIAKTDQAGEQHRSVT